MAGSATVGTAVVKLSFDGKGVKSELGTMESEAEKSGSKIGGAFKSAGKVATAAFATATAAASAMTIGIAKAAVKSYADYEQLAGGVETLFKDSAGIVKQYADQAFVSAGLSANDYMETVTSFSASLLQGLGGDTNAAADIANKAIVDMSDNANKMGTSMEMIQNAYQGFAKQNYTMLDNLKLGYGGTASEMARLINDSGVLGDSMEVTAETVKNVSFDKMIEAIHVVQDNLGITGTTAKEASSTIQGSLNSMKGAWQNAMTGLADDTQDFDLLMSNLVSSVDTFAQNIIPRIVIVLQQIPKLIDWLASSIISELPGLVNNVFPPILQAATSIVQGLVVALPDIVNSLVIAFIDILPQFIDTITGSIPLFVEALMQLLNSLIDAIPNIIPQLVTAITNLITTIALQLTRPDFLTLILQAAVTLLLELVKAIPQILQSLTVALPQIIQNIVGFLLDPQNLQMIIDGAIQLFFGLVLAVPQILGALLAAFGALVGSLWEGIKNLFGQFAANFGNFIGGIFRNAINGVLTFIENFINGPIDLLNGFIDAINGAFGFIGVNIGKVDRIQLPRLATGGLADGATTAIIGEAGKEAVLPLENNTDNWAGLLANTLVQEMEQERIGGSGVTIENQEFIINNQLDAQDIGRVMMQSIRRAA